MKIVIIGGVAGGASAATRLRRNLEEAEILLVERGSEVSFANCGLPYYLGGVIQERSKLLVTSADNLRRRFRLEVRTRTVAESIDPERRQVALRDLNTDKVSLVDYDALILATGAAPLRPPVEGLGLPGVFPLRNLEDTDRIHAFAAGARHATVVGAGFIGLEMVENLRQRGLQVSLVELSPQVLPPLDREMTRPLSMALRDREVDLHLGDSLTTIEPGLKVRLQSGAEWPTDMVLLGVGVRPESALAAQAGLQIGPRGGVRVDGAMRTSDPHIYAVGDVIEVTDVVTGQPTQIPLAGPANRQGRLAADAIAGRQVAYRGTQGTSIVAVFDKTAACTGASEKWLRAGRVDYRKVYVHPNDHAGYYPGAQAMTLKLLYAPGSGKVLGAQAVGGKGVDKRIDVLAVAIQAGMTVFDLEQLELCYAPPYGSAKDPVNMAGFVAANEMRGEHPQISPDQLSGEEILVDVRSLEEHQRGHIPGSRHIPVDELRSRLKELPADRPLTVYCQVGMRGYLATRILMHNGFEVRNLSGGYLSYQMFQ
ncbi:MAG: FAD-dependent oxidoreductase [Candidatus Eremiobacteraeota bacterium]|nr:FAD-dependent oxidoreductase [Candidatus Eremiobacteraeota bacterium]MCW5871826.1 FAD-dependent oxidoreductase [Candidatus Eremiobacteraeota bacterium]